MSIYQEKPFQPTYLYIKQHTVTGKLYFGKTVNDPEKYPGSGTYWKSHIKKYGKERVVTLWYCLFFAEEDIFEFASKCSLLWDIVDNKNDLGKKVWANEIPENGLRGRSVGSIHSDETKDRIRIARKGAPGHKHTQKHKDYMSTCLSGRIKSSEACKNISRGKKSKMIRRFVSPEGIIYDVNDCHEFCDAHKLSYDAMSRGFRRGHPVLPPKSKSMIGNKLERRMNSIGWTFISIPVL